jgi:hypothetical protein
MEQIRSHKEEVARLREQLGDPQEALSRFIVERFEVQALVPAERLQQDSRITVLEEDDDELDAW